MVDSQNAVPENSGADAALIDALRGEAYVRKSNLIERAADRLETLTKERDEAQRNVKANHDVARDAQKERKAAESKLAQAEQTKDEDLEYQRKLEARVAKAEATLAKVREWSMNHRMCIDNHALKDLDAILDGNGCDTE